MATDFITVRLTAAAVDILALKSADLSKHVHITFAGQRSGRTMHTCEMPVTLAFDLCHRCDQVEREAGAGLPLAYCAVARTTRKKLVDALFAA